MEIVSEYPFNHHPCYSNDRRSLWHRIHLPVAPVCNIKCAYCSHSIGASCHTPVPGYSRRIMIPQEAVAKLRVEIKKNPLLRIAAVSGPGEPLANPETFETLTRIREEWKDLAICLSTNGTLLERYIDWMKEMKVDTVTVSMSTSNSLTAAKIYEWARLGDEILIGETMAARIINAQLKGITKASDAGIHIKVNSILIPELNMDDMVPLAQAISDAGAVLHNIIPLVPNDMFVNYRPPSKEELLKARKEASSFMKQFSHCKQCRSDVVGIPGRDRVLD